MPRITTQRMIIEGSCTARWAMINGYRWDAVVIGGDALLNRNEWLASKSNTKRSRAK